MMTDKKLSHKILRKSKLQGKYTKGVGKQASSAQRCFKKYIITKQPKKWTISHIELCMNLKHVKGLLNFFSYSTK